MDPSERLPPVEAPPLPRRAALSQKWRDVVFLHWPLPPETVTPLLPAGSRPDTLDGVTYAGLVAFRVADTRLFGRIPAGRYGEVNVRLYSVDGQGHRGVVFLSLDVGSPHTAAAGRGAAGLPYMWSDVGVGADPQGGIGCTCRRRLPPSAARCRFRIRVGEPIPRPSPLEVFTTARWGLHTRHVSGTRWVRIAHPPWELHRAEAVELHETLLERAGLPRPEGPPSVLYSPGTDTRFAPAVSVRTAG